MKPISLTPLKKKEISTVFQTIFWSVQSFRIYNSLLYFEKGSFTSYTFSHISLSKRKE